MSREHHILILELLQDILGRASTDFNPSLGEQGTCRQNKGNVEDRMEGIRINFGEFPRWRDVIGQSSNRDTAASHFQILPLSEQLDEEVSSETFVEHLGEEIEVGHQGGLKDDGDVRGVEQFDGVGSVMSANFGVLHCQINSEALNYKSLKIKLMINELLGSRSQ